MYVSEDTVNEIWAEMKGNILEAAKSMCRVIKEREKIKKDTTWWDNEVKAAISKQKK